MSKKVRILTPKNYYVKKSENINAKNGLGVPRVRVWAPPSKGIMGKK